MTSSGTTAGRIYAARITIIAAVVAVIAGFTGSTFANAAQTRPGAARIAPPAVRLHHSKAHHTVTKTQAPKFRRTKPATGTRPAAPNPTLKRPARAAKVSHVARRRVALWHGTPSYTVSKATSTAKPNLKAITGITGSCVKSTGNVSGTWSPTSCSHGYEITGDVTVPTGSTLTIKPGTYVYFDAGNGSIGSSDPSSRVDMIVDGGLIVAGSAAKPVTFTSSNFAPNSSTPPAPGDWGYLFFNHTGSAKGGGSMTYLNLSYGQGLAADGVAPSLTHSSITTVAAGTNTVSIASSILQNAGIDYEDVPSVKVVFDHDTFDGAETAGINVVSEYTHTNFAGATAVGHPFTFQLTNSAVTGGNSTGFEDAVNAESALNGASASANHAAVALDVTGNQITQTESGYGLDVEANTEPTTVVGTAAITGVFHDNVINGGSSSYGSYFYTEAADTGSTGLTSCAGASSCVFLPFVRNQISSEYEPVQTYAYVDNGPGKAAIYTPVGKVQKIVKIIKKVIHKHGHKHIKKIKKITYKDISGGSYNSEDSYGWYTQPEAEGSGAAALSMPIVATPFYAYDEDVYTYVLAYQGNATEAVSARHSTMTSSDSDNFYLEAYGSDTTTPPSGSSGTGSSTLTITGGTYTADVYNVETDATYGEYGPAATKTTITGATLTAYEYNVYSEAYGSYAGGSGGGSSVVNLTSDKLNTYYGNVDNYAYGYRGTAPATATVNVSKSTLSSYDEDSIDNYAYSAEDAGSSGNAITNTSVSKSTVEGYSYAIDAAATSYYGGKAISSPNVTGSLLTASEDYGIYNEAYSAEDAGSGAATANPTIKNSVINAYNEALYNDAEAYYGNGNATATPVVSNSTLTADADDTIENYAYGTNQTSSTGSAAGSPQILSSKLNAYDDGVYNYIYAYYGSASGSPVVKSSNVVSGDDEGIYNSIVANESDGYGTAVGNPKVLNSKVTAYDEVVDNEITAYGGAASGSPLFSGSRGSSSDSYGIYNEVYSTESRVGTAGSSAVGSPAIVASTLGVYDDQDIYNDIYSYLGAATGNPSITKGSKVTAADDDNIENNVYADYNETTTGHTATGSPVIDHSSAWAYDDNIDNNVYSYEGPGVGNPRATYDTLFAAEDDAVYNEVYGSEEGNVGPATANPVMSHTTVDTYDYAIDNYAYAYRGTSSTFSHSSDAVANPTLAASTVRSLFEGGVYNEAYGSYNGATENGSATANAKLTSSTIYCGECSDEYGLYNYAESYGGPSTADPTVTNTPITTTYGYGIDNESYSADSGGSGTAHANPVITSSPVTSYYYGLYNYAKAYNGNSNANGSFQVTGSRIHSGYYEAIDATAEGAGTGITTLNPSVTSDVLEAPDDHGMYLTTVASGSGGATIGGTVAGTTITAYDEGFEADSSGTGPSSLTTLIKNNAITSTYYEGIYSSMTATGSSVRVTPTITSTTINAADDNAIELHAAGTTGTSTDVLRVAPVITSSPSISSDGILLEAQDATTANPGVTQVAGSMTNSPVTSYDDYGVEAYSHCRYCTGGAAETFSIKNSPIHAYDQAAYLHAVADNTSAGSTLLGGSVTSTKHSALTSTDSGYGIEGDSWAYGGGNATDHLGISGLVVSGEGGGIYNYPWSESGSVTNTSAITNNVVDNISAAQDDYGIFDDTHVNSGTGTATRTGSISGNTVSGFPGSGGTGIYPEIYSPGAVSATLTMAHNRISNVGGWGIYGYAYSGTPPATGTLTYDHNTIVRTGYAGIYSYGEKAKVTNNVITANGTQGGTSLSEQDGVYVYFEPTAGSVTCNVIWGDVNGLDYTTNPAGADPVTTNNSFVKPGSTVRNSTDLRTDNTGTTNAANNYWGGTPRVVNTSTGTITTSPRLSAAPTCTKTAGA
jgi:hypothetical protein